VLGHAPRGGCRRQVGAEWEARKSVCQRRGARTVIVDWGLQPGDGATLGTKRIGWRKHIVILQIITDGEHIPSHFARRDARERRDRAGEIQGATFPDGYLAMAARDRHCHRRGRGGGYIFDVLATASELAHGARG
jgi:hypothetical protein